MAVSKVLRYRIEKWWWASNVPMALYVYQYQHELWDRYSILYLALVSIYALVATFSGAEQAAEAAQNTD